MLSKVDQPMKSIAHEFVMIIYLIMKEKVADVIQACGCGAYETSLA